MNVGIAALLLIGLICVRGQGSPVSCKQRSRDKETS